MTFLQLSDFLFVETRRLDASATNPPGPEIIPKFEFRPASLLAARRLPDGPLECPCIIPRQVGLGKTTANNTIKSIIRERHMYRLTVITISACAALLLAGAVYAQQQPAAPASPPPPPPAYGAPITLEQAKAAIAAATEESKKNGWNHVFAVVDGGGNLIAFEKADLAGNASIKIAEAKAASSATFRVPTKVYQDRLAAGETFILGLPGMVPAAGGVPIVVNGKLIGAIGVSGAAPLQDHQSGVVGAAAVK
jgi:glc operon protein GlcG